MLAINVFFCFMVNFAIIDSVRIGEYANGVAFGYGFVWATEAGQRYI